MFLLCIIYTTRTALNAKNSRLKLRKRVYVVYQYFASCAFHATMLTEIMRQVTYSKLLRFRTVFLGRAGTPTRRRSLLSSSQLGLSQPSCLSTDAAHASEQSEEFDDTRHQASSQYDVLYPGHISTSLFQKSLLALGSGIACLLNPARDDMICTLGETTGPPALRYMHKKMLADPVGRQILEERPILNTQTIDVDYLGRLPDGTFGKAYWNFLSANGFSPDARRPVNFVDDAELMYVMLRYRQCHDLVHTLLGMPPNMLGEVAVKWFEAVQTGLPLCVTAALFGPIRLGPKHREKYINIYLPWAVRSGYNSRFLMNVYFEKHWEQDMEELRRELSVEPAPVPLIKTGKHTMTK